MSRLDATLSAIDAANAADPDTREGAPAAQLYGQRMSAELERLFPDASEALKIAVRGQHIERWTSPRSSYPEGRQGYLTWRRDLAAYHARRVGEIMAEAGYDDATIAQVGTMIRKEGIKRDAEVQALEDTVCFVFLRWYFSPFAEGRDMNELLRIVEKTARKMSSEARTRAVDEFGLPEPFRSAVLG